MANDSIDSLAEQLAAEAEALDDKKKAPQDGGDDPAQAEAETNKKEHNLSLILDIPLRVTVELGRTKMPVSELLNLGQGSVIELNKLAGEPMEVLVNDKLIARGEAVVVNEKFGVRLTDIISPAERVEQLN